MVLGRINLHHHGAMKLAPNFTLAELTRTSHRRFLGENRNPPPDVVEALRATAEMLQVVRDRWGVVTVTSGYRCPDLNTAIGSNTKRSQHPRGQAADFVAGDDLQEVWEWIWKESSIRETFGQCILEGWSQGPGGMPTPGWIHLSLGPPWWSRSGEVLTWNGAKYTRIDTSGVKVV
jgi:zinc D-Ala-D-Ala carboxypeptidase